MTPKQREAVERRHVVDLHETFYYYGEKREVCKACRQNWPCDAILLLREQQTTCGCHDENGKLAECVAHASIRKDGRTYNEFIRLYLDGRPFEKQAKADLDALLAQERERCAKVAEQFYGCGSIAAAIRAGGKGRG